MHKISTKRMRHLAQRNSQVYEVKERLDVEQKSLISKESTCINKSYLFTHIYGTNA